MIRKGFTSADSTDIIAQAVEIFPRVDAFYIWGFPFETMNDFNQSLFRMVSLRMMGARILPSLLSYLPQTQIYRELPDKGAPELCPYLLPEFIFTGHEELHGANVAIPEKHRRYFDLVTQNPDIFPGFLPADAESNVLPKPELLRELGFYPQV